jgi:3'-5' exonuclease
VQIYQEIIIKDERSIMNENIKDNLEDILLFDIETVSEHAEFEELDSEWQKLWSKEHFHNEEEKDPAKLYKLKAGLKPEYSKVVCASVGKFTVQDDNVTLLVKAVTEDGKGEGHLLDTFAKIVNTKVKTPEGEINRYKKTLTHNGKNFDIPFLAKRYLIHEKQIPNLLFFPNKPTYQWNSAIDTQEMWKFGTQTYPSLDLISKCFGLPLKHGIEGKNVRDIYYEKSDLASIAKYCNEDVVALANIYLKIVYPQISINKVEIK